ncbi:ABC transporter permease [Cohaesibacter gelatinilyticus]|uniref:Iron(III) transport system permease protein n=1 Tax=Cohaesibacter gelatinilyticus TaxID=372072 RepID=A0A285NB25_9HYPH|nr:iron ABC transporter permease [Cohaesibacter gelatinilyticus]SNZ06113.1 iron(III) transport system permease protein [Cohaesibacter gelatinilyticus]
MHDLAANVKQDQTSILQEKSQSFGLVNRVRVRIVRADLRTWIGWLLLVLLLFFVLAPIVSLLILALGDAGDVWPHLVRTVLPRAVLTTAQMMLGVGCLTVLIGVSTAWLVTMCRFPGRQFFQWALLVPLAIPTYIVAYTSVELLDYTGPAQSLIRWLFGFTSARDYWFPEIRSLGGAIVVMSLVLYPYVYLTTRATFMLQSACSLDVSRTLGAGPIRLFFTVALPLARPAIVVGATLAIMECLNDIGAVEFFGVKTLTFSVYDTWLNRSSLAGAAQISSVMLVVVLLLLWLERHGRRNQRYHVTTRRYQALPSYWLRGWRSWAAIVTCSLPILLGFVLPTMVLLRSSFYHWEDNLSTEFIQACLNSLGLALAAALLTASIGTALAYLARIQDKGYVTAITRLSSIGYAVPGTVLAVGILIPVATLDNWIASSLKNWFGIAVGLILLSSGIAMLYAYCVRFMAMSYGAGETGLQRISTNMEAAARTLGRTPFQTLVSIDLPLIRPALVSGALLVFVDVMKELPATILLRPFNFDTLATLVYGQASLEAFEKGSLAALAIVAVGIVPVILLSRTSGRSYIQQT